MFVEIIK